jgi:hypothetical protein
MQKLFRQIVAAAALLIGTAVPAFGQSSPNLVFGQVPTAAQWNSYFIAKQDVLGYQPVNKAGDIMTGRLVMAAPTTTGGINLTPGTAPGSPVNGDLWVTSSSIFAQINGSTVDLDNPFGAIGAHTVLGNATGSPANATALSQTQLTALVNNFSSSLAGDVPASTGSSSDVLHGDGTWAPASGGGACGTDTQYLFNDASSCGASDAIVATASYSAAWGKAIDEIDFTGNFSGADDITSASAAPSSNNFGNDLQFQVGNGDGTGSGGWEYHTGGNAGLTGNGTGGGWEFDGGTGHGTGGGGAFYGDAGEGGFGNGGGEIAADGGDRVSFTPAGGDAGIFAGNANSSSEYNGGQTNVKAGAGAYNGGAGGTGGTTHLIGGNIFGGSITCCLSASEIDLTGATKAVGGGITITLGDGYSSTGADGGHDPGTFNLTGGTAEAGHTGSDINITAGQLYTQGHSGGGRPGKVNIYGGNNDNGAGADTVISGGTGTTIGGGVWILGNLGATGGRVLAQGASSESGGTAGYSEILGGTAQFLSDTPGDAIVYGGTGNTSSPTGPGNAIVHGGDNGGGGNHDGGNVKLIGGAKVGTGRLGFVDASGALVVELPVYTVATLPTCNSTIHYSMAAVSDATTPSYNGSLTGGSTVKVPVFCDGSSWTSH